MKLARVVLLVGVIAALGVGSGVAEAKGCGEAGVMIRGGSPAEFGLPKMEGERVEAEPESVLTVQLVNPPPNASVRWGVAGIGRLGSRIEGVQSGAPVAVDLSEYSSYGHGLFGLEVTVESGGNVLCTVPFELRVTGFGGTFAVGSIVASAVSAGIALLTMLYTVQGTQAKVTASVAVQRRRKRGWRRWVPVPAWKRTIIGTVVGAITGLCVTALLQQAGVTPLGLAAAVWGLIAGGAVAFGMGVGVGAVWTYVKRAEEGGPPGPTPSPSP